MSQLAWVEHAGLPGRMMPPEEPAVPAADRGLTLGDGLFETIRVAGGRAPLLGRHLARLTASAALLGYGPLPWDAAALVQRCARLIGAAGPARDAALRLTLTRGPGPRGYAPPAHASPTLIIAVHPLPPPPGAPWRAAVAGVRRQPHPVLTRVKHTSALELVWARAEAAAAGADEAVLLNTAGRLAEGAGSNLFAVVDGELCTPPVEDGCLPGVARSLLLELAAAAGLPARTAPLSPAALRAATEAFATNALIGPVPLGAVTGLPGGDAAWPAPGPVTARLAAAWQGALAAPAPPAGPRLGSQPPGPAP